jgi:uncharacterized membrane protein YkvA (DUF1232 family)
MNAFGAILKTIDVNFVLTGAARISKDDVKTVLERMHNILQKVQRSGVLEGLLSDVQWMFCLVQDYWNGTYRRVPFRTIASVVFALLYVFWPADLIPDVIPVLGQLDDAAVVTMCLKLVRKDLEEYRKWKEQGAGEPVPAV